MAARRRPGGGQVAARRRPGDGQMAARGRPGGGQAAARRRPGGGHAAAIRVLSSWLLSGVPCCLAMRKLMQTLNSTMSMWQPGGGQVAARGRPGSGQAAARRRPGGSQGAARRRPGGGQAAARRRPGGGQAAASNSQVVTTLMVPEPLAPGVKRNGQLIFVKLFSRYILKNRKKTNNKHRNDFPKENRNETSKQSGT